MAGTFEESYYKITKMSLRAIGQWPDHDTRFVASEIIVVTPLASFLVTQVLKLVTSWRNLGTVTAVVPVLLAFATGTAKFYTYVLNRKTMQCLLDRMRSDWEKLMTKPEMLILQRHAEEAKRYITVYAFMAYLTVLLFIIVPLIPLILDVLVPLNESRPRLKVFEAEYLFDDGRYFYLTLCHQVVAVGVLVTVIVGTDTMYIVYTLHACAMFAIVGYNLEHSVYSCSVENRKGRSAAVNKNATVRRKIVHCIGDHMKTIEFAEMIESCFTYSFLFVTTADVIALSCTLLQVILVMHDLHGALKYGIFVATQMIHMLAHTFPGQRLIDQSTNVSASLYNGKWYEIPTKFQKLLLLMMRRSMEPCNITAGKIMIMSLTSFSAVLQSSVSYFTMLCSLQ